MAKQLICSACGYVGSTKRVPKGSLGVEIVLWLFFLLPGLVYSIWRQSSYHQACPVCGGTNLIPIDSPVGQKLLKEQGNIPEQVVKESTDARKREQKKKVWIGIVIGIIVAFGAVTLLSTNSKSSDVVSASPTPTNVTVTSAPTAQEIAQYAVVFGSTVVQPLNKSGVEDTVAALDAVEAKDFITAQQ